jgi:hypothetical protein
MDKVIFKNTLFYIFQPIVDCVYCDILGLSGVSIVTWWLLLHNSEFVTFP